MQTSAPGICSQSHGGFTLLELLIVIVVVSIATALVAVQGTLGEGRHLAAEARKLSQLLRIAQQQARLKSRVIRLVASPQRYQFEYFNGSGWEPVQDEPLLRARSWSAPPLNATFREQGQAVAALELQPEPGLYTQQVVLSQNHYRIVLNRHLNAQFVPETAQPETGPPRTP